VSDAFTWLVCAYGALHPLTEIAGALRALESEIQGMLGTLGVMG